MEDLGKKQYNGGTHPASENEALLNEFFSIIAGITLRLINNNVTHDNNIQPSKVEGE